MTKIYYYYVSFYDDTVIPALLAATILAADEEIIGIKQIQEAKEVIAEIKNTNPEKILILSWNLITPDDEMAETLNAALKKKIEAKNET